MAYTINLTNGAIFATIPDGTRDTSSSLVIIGKNYTGYGEFIGENFVRVLENHANTLPPDNPLTGQLWYDINETTLGLNVYDGTTFKTLGTTITSITEPAKKVTGDSWYDTSTEQMKVFNGTTYELVGPLYTSTTGKTGPIVQVLLDTGSTEHVATVNYVEGNVVSIEHKDTPFTLHPSTPIAGYPGLIYPGIHLVDDVAGEVPQLTGTATNSILLNGVDSDGYLSALNNDTTAGTLGVLNDGGLVVGEDSDLQLTITGSDAFITNSTTNGRVVIQANPLGVTKDVITVAIDGAEARARVFTPLNALDIANMDYVDTTTLALDGSRPMAGDLDMGNNAIVNVAVDSRYVTKEIDSIVNTAGGTRLTVQNDAGALGTSLAGENTIQIYQPTTGADAFMTFNVESDHAVHFGVSGASNDLFVGGLSEGIIKHKVWHSGNDGPGSGLNADYLDNYSSGSFLKTTSGIQRDDIRSPFKIMSRKFSAGNRSASNTLSYSAPSWANYVLVRFVWTCYSSNISDMRWAYAYLGGIEVIGVGADDTDQGAVSAPFAVSEVWVSKYSTTLGSVTNFQTSTNFVLEAWVAGYHA